MKELAFTLKIGGQAPSASVLASILDIEVEDNADLADMVRLRLGIGLRKDASGWTLLDDELFTRLAKLELGVSIAGKKTSLVEAYVVDASIELSSRPGESVLSVVAMDPTVLLDLEEKVKEWPDMSDSAIAQAIFADHGLDCEVESTEPTRQAVDHTTIQRGTDMRFLRQLADRNGYECFVEIDDQTGRAKGHFHPPRLEAAAQGVLSVNMGSATNVAVFKARHDMLQPTTVEVKGLDVASKDDQSAAIERSEKKKLGTKPADDAGDRPRKVLLSRTGLAKAGELQTVAQAVVDRSAWAITAEGEVEADVYGGVLRAKRPVKVRGAGAQFSGTYYVDRVLHVIAGGRHVQRFSLRRTATGLPRNESFKEERGLPE